MKTALSFIKKILNKIFIFIKSHQLLLIIWLIIALALILRIWNILGLPSAFSSNEIEVLKQVKAIEGNGWLIQNENIFSAIYLYLIGFLVKIFGLNFLALKLFQALVGTLTVGIFYLFTKEWFNKQIALLASLFLATNAFHLAVSRELEPMILAPLALILTLYTLTIAIRSGKYKWFVSAGILFGSMVYTNMFFVFLPLVFLISFMMFYKKNKKILTFFWKKYLVFLVAFLAASIPFILSFPVNIGKIIENFTPGSFGQYFMNLGAVIQSLLYRSIPAELYYVGTEPILSPFVAIAFLCGLLYALFHIERRKYFFIIALLVIFIGIIALMSDQLAINYLVLLPVCFLFASIILDYFLTTWLATFPFNKSARIALAFLLSFMIFLTVNYNFEKYFYAWGRNETIQDQFSQGFDYQKQEKP